MKYSCNVVQDLLPLYQDNVCSEDSKKIVEAHLAECNTCRQIQKKMNDPTYDNSLRQERKNVVSHYNKQVKKRSVFVGIYLTGVFAIPILICLICNIVLGQALDWFFIVLTGLMVFASITVVPLLIKENKGIWTLCCYTTSLLLLLLSCSLYNKGHWFFIAAISTVFGIALIFLPYVLRQLPLRGFAANNKSLIVMIVDTVLLYGVIIACGLYVNVAGYWEIAIPITTVCVFFAWILFALFRYLRVHAFIRAGACVILSSVFLVFIKDIVDWIIQGTAQITIGNANLLTWDHSIINANIYLLLLLFGVGLGTVLLVAGVICQCRNSKNKQ